MIVFKFFVSIFAGGGVPGRYVPKKALRTISGPFLLLFSIESVTQVFDK